MEWETHKSKLDSSVNFVANQPDGGKLEARYVQRESDQFIIYLSSHTGCKKSCRFCHLTATRQVQFTPTPVEGYHEQAWIVYEHYDALRLSQTPSRVNYNWMARGEALANPAMLETPKDVLETLNYMARERGLVPRFKISTIMPYEVENLSLVATFPQRYPVDFYYSLYSVDEGFRKRWLPKALPTDVALSKLADYQKETDQPIWFHWTFIHGENDDIDTVYRILDAINEHEIRGRFNLVRYNPPNDKSRESDPEVIDRNYDLIKRSMDHAQIVSRVGFDVQASCGMFVT